jgi:hypothetical protein
MDHAPAACDGFSSSPTALTFALANRKTASLICEMFPRSNPTRPPGPTLGQPIVPYAQARLGQCVNSVGNAQPGACAAPEDECTHLVQAALRSARGRPPNSTQPPTSGGIRVGSGMSPPPLLTGDVLQFVNARLQLILGDDYATHRHRRDGQRQSPERHRTELQQPGTRHPRTGESRLETCQGYDRLLPAGAGLSRAAPQR